MLNFEEKSGNKWSWVSAARNIWFYKEHPWSTSCDFLGCNQRGQRLDATDVAATWRKDIKKAFQTKFEVIAAPAPWDFINSATFDTWFTTSKDGAQQWAANRTHVVHSFEPAVPLSPAASSLLEPTHGSNCQS